MSIYDDFSTAKGVAREGARRKTTFDDEQYLRNLYQEGVDNTLYNRENYPAAQAARLGQAAQVDPALANRLGAIASGQQQGAGELAAQRQANRSVAQQQAMARMGRAPGAGRTAARNIADIGVGAAGQAQQAAMQDQQGANQLLGSIAAQNAQMQQQATMQQGSMDQQAALANLDARLRYMGMNDQTRLAYLNQLAQMNRDQMNARLGREASQAGQPSDIANFMQTAGPLIAAGAMAMSDKRAKKNIRDGGADVDAMLDELKAVTYEYKDGAPKEYVGQLGDGRRIAGFIAQDLAKSKAGKAIVSETPDGKQVVDVRGGLFAAIAASARLNERVRKLENDKK